MSSETGQSWSEWMDFDKSNVETVPEAAGVFSMHATMKTLYIGGSENLRNALLDCLSHPCIGRAKRFRYMLTQSQVEVKGKLLSEYRLKHDGKLPECSQQ